MRTYKVQPRDTLGKIAKRFYGDAGRFPLIVAANHIANPDKLLVGQELVIPDLKVALAVLGTAPPATSPAPPVPAAPASGAVQLSEQRLKSLHPALASRGRRLLDLCAHAGLAIFITQGLRTWEEQDKLYASGRTVPPVGKKHVVTNARGGESWHNFGLAFDIVVLDSVGKANWDTSHPGWKQAGELGKSLGLEWGGEWKKFKDLPHFQYTGGLTLARCRELYPLGLEAIWSEMA